MKALLAVLCLALAGCATDSAVIREAPTVVVHDEVRKPCIDRDKVPVLPVKPAPQKDADEKQENAAVAAYVIALEAFAVPAYGLLLSCSK